MPPAADDPILGTIRTLDEKDAFLSEVQALGEELYRVKTGHSLSEIFPEALRREAAIRRVDLDNREEARTFLLELKEKATNLPVLSITLAFKPTQTILNALSVWVRVNLTPALILDITVDRTILGGAILAFNGVYKDFNLRKRLEESFANNKEAILAKTQVGDRP